MREPMIVERAALFPYACSCGSAHGPLLDTFFENAVGRVYVCKRCAKTYARMFGFAPGKRLDEVAEMLTRTESIEAEFQKAQAELEAANERERALAVELADARSLLGESLGRERTRAHLDAQLGELVAAREHVDEAVAG